MSTTPATVAETITASGASCRLHRDAPTWDGQRTAAIGAFECDSPEAGAAMLGDIAARLRVEGVQALIGPMDGDTWHAYRLVCETDGSPAFPLEPVSGPHDHAAFLGAGFAPISSYVSARASLAVAIGTEPAPALPGIGVVAWDGHDAEGLFGRVFDMSLAAFSRNAFYKPITRAAFLDLYRPLIPALDPRSILFALTPTGDIVGFLFAYPNLAEGPRPHSIIVKTYASGRRGVGRLLVHTLHRNAREQGCTHAIHALMHVDNASRDRSDRHGGHVFRRYALMGRRLDSGHPT